MFKNNNLKIYEILHLLFEKKFHLVLKVNFMKLEHILVLYYNQKKWTFTFDNLYRVATENILSIMF